jgi:hypothetical protein
MMMGLRRVVNPRTVDDVCWAGDERIWRPTTAVEIICARSVPEKKKSRAQESPA